MLSKKVSRNDFLKLIGGGSAALGASALSAGVPVHPTRAGLVDEPAKPKGSPLVIDESKYFEATEAVVFDRIIFDPGTQIPSYITMLSTPVGQHCPLTGRIKTLGFTNLHTACGFPAPYSFFVRCFTVFVNRGADRDLRSIGEAAWEFWLCNKIYQRGSINTDARFGEQKQPSFEYPAGTGLYIPMQYQFHTTITGEGFRTKDASDGGKGLDLTFEMRGLQWRSIQ